MNLILNPALFASVLGDDSLQCRVCMCVRICARVWCVYGARVWICVCRGAVFVISFAQCFVCACVCVWVCVPAHACVGMCVCGHELVRHYLCVCACVRACVHVNMCACACVCLYVNMCGCAAVPVWECLALELCSTAL